MMVLIIDESLHAMQGISWTKHVCGKCEVDLAYLRLCYDQSYSCNDFCLGSIVQVFVIHHHTYHKTNKSIDSSKNTEIAT